MAKSWGDYISFLWSALRCKRGKNSKSQENMGAEQVTTSSEKNLEESPGQSKLLFRAIRSKNIQEFQLVLETLTACDANDFHDEEGYTVLHRLISVCDDWDQSEDAIDQILKCGADPNISTQDNLKRTALHLLIDNESFSTRRKQILQHFLKTDGINVNTCDRFENSALKLAVEKGYLEVAEMLISSKADVNKPDDSGCIPLYFAVKKENPEMAEMLLKNKADSTHINDMEHCKQTALHLAVENKNPELVKLLLSYGNREALLKKNKNEETPQAAAERISKKLPNSKPVENILNMLSNPESDPSKYQLGQSEGLLERRPLCFMADVEPNQATTVGNESSIVFNVTMKDSVASFGQGATVNYIPRIPDSQIYGAEEQMSGLRSLFTENVSNPANLQQQSQRDNNSNTNFNIKNDQGVVVVGNETIANVSPIRKNGSDVNDAPNVDEDGPKTSTVKLARVKLEK